MNWWYNFISCANQLHQFFCDLSCVELKISDNEALEILKAASHGTRLDGAGGSHAIVNGNCSLSPLVIIVGNINYEEKRKWKIIGYMAYEYYKGTQSHESCHSND